LNLDDAVVLETFYSRIEAEMAAGLLESEGVPALVMADDAGGAYPSLQFVRGVRLMVAAADRYRAREILQAMEVAEELPEDEQPEEK
jgi:putative signal transducing protein